MSKENPFSGSPLSEDAKKSRKPSSKDSFSKIIEPPPDDLDEVAEVITPKEPTATTPKEPAFTRPRSASFSLPPDPKRRKTEGAELHVDPRIEEVAVRVKEEPHVPPISLLASSPKSATSLEAASVPTTPKASPVAATTSVTPSTPSPTSSIVPSASLTVASPAVLSIATPAKTLRSHIESQIKTQSYYELKNLEETSRKGFSLNEKFSKAKIVEVEERGEETVCKFTGKEIKNAAEILLDGFIASGKTDLTIDGSDPKMITTLTELAITKGGLNIQFTETAKKVLSPELMATVTANNGPKSSHSKP